MLYCFSEFQLQFRRTHFNLLHRATIYCKISSICWVHQTFKWSFFFFKCLVVLLCLLRFPSWLNLISIIYLRLQFVFHFKKHSFSWNYFTSNSEVPFNYLKNTIHSVCSDHYCPRTLRTVQWPSLAEGTLDSSAENIVISYEWNSCLMSCHPHAFDSRCLKLNHSFPNRFQVNNIAPDTTKSSVRSAD